MSYTELSLAMVLYVTKLSVCVFKSQEYLQNSAAASSVVGGGTSHCEDSRRGDGQSRPV